MICVDCKRTIDGIHLEMGVPPLYKGDQYATCKPCRDAPYCQGGCFRTELDGVKLVQVTGNITDIDKDHPVDGDYWCRDCIHEMQKMGFPIREVEPATLVGTR